MTQYFDIKKLALSLVNSDTENEVIKVLKDYGFWESGEDIWKPYGGVNNNSGQIHAQSSDSTSAIVEKLTNSGDSLLTLEAYKRGIDPKSDDAPKNMKEALELFFQYLLQL